MTSHADMTGSYLIVRFETLRQRVVNDVSHVRLVDAHAETERRAASVSVSLTSLRRSTDLRDGCADDVVLALLPSFLHPLAVILVHALRQIVTSASKRLCEQRNAPHDSASRGSCSHVAACQPCPRTSSSTSSR